MSRCPARRSLPAAGLGPGSCPSAAPAGGCSLSAAAVALAPGGPSRSKSCGEGCTTHGPPRSQRGGPTTRSCPHPWPPRRSTTWGCCRPASGGQAPQCSRTRPRGGDPCRAPACRRGSGHLTAAVASSSAASGQSLSSLGGERQTEPVRRRHVEVLSNTSPCPPPHTLSPGLRSPVSD